MSRAPDTSAARRTSQRRDWRAVASAWGPAGNQRLTSAIGLVLLVLLGVESLTVLALGADLPVHIFLGLVLLAPVALKLASTGWRFLRYYMGNRPYRLEGPPRTLLRVLAPLLVVSTATLFGSGVALIVVGHGDGPLRRLHGISFVVWGVLMIVHVAAYVTRALRTGTADWRLGADAGVAGSRSRRAVIVGTLLAGVVIALATYPAQERWLSHRHDHPRADRVTQAAAAGQRASMITPSRKREDTAA
jgi:hypothetical protein